MQAWLFALEQRLLFFARRAGVKIFAGAIACFLVILGLGFLVFALWLVAQDALGEQGGAVALGVGFVAAGGLVLWLGTLYRRTPPPPPPPPVYSSPKSASIVAIVEAFLAGVSAARGRKHDVETTKQNDD